MGRKKVSPYDGLDQGQIMSLIRETHRQREDFLRQMVATSNRISAIFRRLGFPKGTNWRSYLNGRDKPSLEQEGMLLDAFYSAYALMESFDELVLKMKPLTKRMEKLAEHLLVWQWTEECRGISGLSLSQLVAEIGNASDYATISRVWKRMGLGVMPDGTRQRRVRGEEGKKHGYSPRRRSVAWNVGANLMRAKNPTYYPYYVEERARLAELHPDYTKAHLHNMAHRHMTKRFLIEFWTVWNTVYAPTAPVETIIVEGNEDQSMENTYTDVERESVAAD